MNLDSFAKEINDGIQYYSLKENYRDEKNGEPASLKQLNISLSDNINKIQQLKNDIYAKNNLIQTKLKKIHDDEIFLLEVEKDKFMHIDQLSEHKACELASGFRDMYQFKIFKFIFDILFNYSNISNNTQSQNKNNFNNLNNTYTINNTYTNTTNNSIMIENEILSLECIIEIDLEMSEKNKNRILNQFRQEVVNKFHEFKNKLKNIYLLKCGNESVEKIKEVNIKLEDLKIEAELNCRDEFYENFFYYLFKYIKLIIFSTLGRLRIDKINDSVQKVHKYFYLF